ncbi:MAG: bifunctional YncE family protein/alkaline phosphatase family protein [Acidobacteria bacterium]|nr:bifunctional YncE family protein/alkaline phosphatase family protein [Acidobacteriota bacterium]
MKLQFRAGFRIALNHGAFAVPDDLRRPWAMIVLLTAALGSAAAAGDPAPPYLHAPSVDTYATHDSAGLTILTNGRHLTPVGQHLPLARWPHGLAMSRDGSRLFVASDSVGQVVTQWQAGSPKIVELMPVKLKGKKKAHWNAGGADFSPDGDLLYWSSGERGTVFVFDTRSSELLAEISLNVPVMGKQFEDSYAADLKVSADGRHVYCADVTNFRLVIIDTQQRSVVGSAAVGRYPYTLAVAGDRVLVANIGLFEYSPVPPPAGGKFDKRGLTRPAFGYPSKQARNGGKFEGRKIPGLGDANVPESFSVWSVDVSNPAAPQVAARWKTGLLIDAPSDNGKAVGGSAPNFLAVRGDALFVSNGNNDIIERIDMSKGGIQASRRIVPSPLVSRLRGVGPSGMVVSPDGSRLYVAESGINAIGVLDAGTLQVLGHIPTAWYPYRLALSPDGRRLACVCFKGFGNGPNAGKDIPKSNFLQMRGVISILDAPSNQALGEMTQQVLELNGMVDHDSDRAAMAFPVIPTVPGQFSREIKYVVFITKENHTYDTIFDRLPGARHDPSLLRWGLHQTIKGDGQPTLDDVGVMVNHNALARQFTVSDNFYMEPEASGVGHRWLVGVQPNNLMQMTYSLGWSFKKDSTAPGRRYSMGSAGSLIPEDYPEAGSMWEHLDRHRIGFRNYGEGFEFPGVRTDENERPTGAREVVNIPMPKALFDNTSFGFPIFNMNIPDQYRAHWFMQDVEKRFLRGGRKFPSFVNIAICNDHGSSPKPEKGYPYLASWMADNDLALGRIVEFLSHTPYWKNMAIFVTQDDAGGEPDHVDAQRSVLLVISPWAKKSYVSHRHTTILSMHRTLYQIFGLPPLNMFDALANDLSDSFTTQPDFRPYTAVPVDPRIFDPEKAKDPKDPDYGRARRMRSVPMDDDDEMERVLRRGEKEVAPRR